MPFWRRLLTVVLLAGMAASCSGTKVSDSWTKEDFHGSFKNVYIIGIAKKDYNRMLFENTFRDRLLREGLNAFPSYVDLPKDQQAEREAIIQKMEANACDAVLLTKLLGQRTTATVGSGKSGSYRFVPEPHRTGWEKYQRPGYYNSWDGYYTSSYRVVYEPPSTKTFVVLTVESVLYDLDTQELVWSAQMETELEGNLEDMMRQFADKVTEDLLKKGLI